MKSKPTSTTSTPKKARRGLPPANWPTRFIKSLGELGNVRAACEIAAVSRQTAYGLRKADEAFGEAWAEALTASVESLESVAWERARAGSDVLLIFLLKANFPEKYRETHRLEHSGKLEGQAGVVIYVPDDGRSLPA